jgi:membrane associated rhomboid family serine protease
MPAIAVIGMWIVFQFINGIGQLAQTEQTGGVAYAAHIGGFVAGLLLVWVFRDYGGRRFAGA